MQPPRSSRVTSPAGHRAQPQPTPARRPWTAPRLRSLSGAGSSEGGRVVSQLEIVFDYGVTEKGAGELGYGTVGSAPTDS